MSGRIIRQAKNTDSDFLQPRIAVLIPCYNEELTVGRVVKEFRERLPNAEIYVYDNNSTDRTVEEAEQAGAHVSFVRHQGKGYVVQAMFRQIDADIYVMVDGDGTYPPEFVHQLIAPVIGGVAEMVVGSRLHNLSQSKFKSLNRFGNKLFLLCLNTIFKVKLTDILSGYRVFSRRFVKGIALFGGGFELETELTIKALERGYEILEIPVDLVSRPEGSFSKIRIVRDGFLILSTIIALFRDYKPLTFFGGAGLSLMALGLVPGLMVVLDYVKSGLVPRLPSAVLAVALILFGMLLLMAGLILHTIARRAQQFDHYLTILTEELKIRSADADQPRREPKLPVLSASTHG